MNIDIASLNDGDGIEPTLQRHSARWHKACRLKVNQIKLERLERSMKSKNDMAGPSSIATRSRHAKVDLTEDICFLCNEPAGSTALHRACTHDIHAKVQRCAITLKDTDLLAKLAPGDMVALEAKYHTKCLANLYNRARAATESAIADTGVDVRVSGIAFAELVTFMEENRREEGIVPTFKLSDLARMYKARLEQLGVSVEGRIHSTRLKARLLAVIPDLQAHSQGRDVLLTFDVGTAIKTACDHDSDAMLLARAAQLVRKEMFDKIFHFDGSFKPECQQKSVPTSLLSLVNMILKGPNIKQQSKIDTVGTSAALSVSQLLIFNRVKHERGATPTNSTYHRHERETPLPIFVALKIHAVTCSRNLIDTRDGDLDSFFKHENQNTPPSLSLGGKIRLGTKADLHCLQLEESQDMNAPVVSAKFFDGAVIVQMLHPGTAKTFQEYADVVFIQYISSQLERVEQVDIVWDVYIQDSLKSTTRQKRGKGVRRRVASATAIPQNWKNFLCLDENKTELFAFLAHNIKSISTEEGKDV